MYYKGRTFYSVYPIYIHFMHTESAIFLHQKIDEGQKTFAMLYLYLNQ